MMNIDTYNPNKQQMLNHLIALHGDNPQGYIAVTQFDEKGYPIQEMVEVNGVEGLKRVVIKSLEMQSRTPYRNTYYSVCMFKTNESRKADNALSVPGVWLDLDAKTGTHSADNLPIDPLDALQIMTQITGKPPTMAVNTFGGLHGYYLFDKPFICQNPQELSRIKQVMKDFRAAFQSVYADKYGYQSDSVCQPAGVLRLPGMINRKYNQVVEYMEQSGARYTIADIIAISEHMNGGTILTEPKKPKQSENPLDVNKSIVQDKRPDVICNECAFMKHWRDDAAELTEPEWYAGITILARDDVIGGYDFIHEHSAKYAGYMPAETDRKIDHARKSASGPRTCKAIAQDTGNAFCQTCRHKDSHIGTPATLGSRLTIEEEFGVYEEDNQQQIDEERAKFELEQMAYFNHSAGHYAEVDFGDNIKRNAHLNAIPTGFDALDNMLEGGLYPSVYFIGAISSLGKTTFCIQLGDQVAQQGHDVMIFSLEQSKDELIAKSISRITYTLDEDRKKSNAKTHSGILNGKRYGNYSPKEMDIIKTATKQYTEYAKGRIYIFEGVGDIGVKQIAEKVEKHIAFTGRRPLVILDYLQILAPLDNRATDKQNTDRNVTELKRLSRDHKLCIIGISSFNRDNYNAEVSMSAFKESGAIEYSSDVLLGLQLKGTGERDFDVDKAKSEDLRQVELKILKNRNGRSGRIIDFDYYPMFNVFHEVGLQPPKPPKPPKTRSTNGKSQERALIEALSVKPSDLDIFDN